MESERYKRGGCLKVRDANIGTPLRGLLLRQGGLHVNVRGKVHGGGGGCASYIEAKHVLPLSLYGIGQEHKKQVNV